MRTGSSFLQLLKRNVKENPNHFPNLYRFISTSQRPSFGIAFDIDGVILRGNSLIDGSPEALRKLYSDSGTLKIPFVFLTNGGGFSEAKRALELGKQLGLKILPSQVLQGHTPFRHLVNKYKSDLVIAIGKGEPAEVMSEYGFQNVVSIDDYASWFDNIDPLAEYKRWATRPRVNEKCCFNESNLRKSRRGERVGATFVVSDSVDWSRDIQVLCDVLRTGGLPGKGFSHQTPIYFASDDLEYQGLFPSERLGMGAFRIALESIYNRISPIAMEYTSFGKPNSFVFRNAETTLSKLLQPENELINDPHAMHHGFETLYMVGDNPAVDIKGAQQAGHPWSSILTRSGVFKGNENHSEFHADMVVDNVSEAVDYIFTKERYS